MTEQKKIIVVDDNMENLTALKNTLKDLYEVYPSPSALKMFDLLEHIQPDLILMDVGMPVMNGYEAARKLKSDGKYRHIPIMFLTSMDDADSEMEGLSIGAVDYIHKPFVAQLLLQRIKTHLSLVDQQKEIEKLLELKTKEVSLREAAEQEARNASRAKGEFLSHMSHEIRSPLNAVIGMINIASDADETQTIKRYLEKAGSASKYVLGVINDILDMSKIEAGKFELSYGEFDIEKMLVDIINVTNVRAEEKHQNFAVNLDTNVPPFLIGDELRLSQVITNLLTNAIKFTPENGKIVLHIEKAADSDGEITLKTKVEDNGIGITEEQQKRLFSSYGQADSGISKTFGGTGLGLVISKQIVELMQGRIWIESEIDKGSKFIFTVKVKKGSEKVKTRLSPKLNMDDVRILAVDDSEETRTYFAQIMKAFKLPFDTAAGGAEAIGMIKNCGTKPYNIFFVDWEMPEMDGIELTKKIKEISGDKSNVIMFTMSDWSNIKDKAVAAGVKQFIPKPIFPSVLLNAINECVEITPKAYSSEKGSGESAFNFKGHTILVAEDTEFNREILSKYLEKTGISIVFAENGKIAVSMFREDPGKYSLVFMDVHMPEMDGYEATRAIRAFERERSSSSIDSSFTEGETRIYNKNFLKQIPIIAMTANVFREDIEICLAVGMNDHIGKPIFPKDVYEKLKKYLFA
jgi:CheY-like chemotaxis protein/nitrogen-specific signal transduction histidine kinase